MREIYELEFDAATFVANTEKAINIVESLDSTLKSTAESAANVSLSKPISELSKLKKLLSEGSDLTGFDEIFKNFDKNTPKIKAYLEELKKALKKTTNPEEFKTLNAVIAQTERALKEASGEAKGFGKAVEDTTKKQISLRQEIKKNTVELQQLSKEGKTATKQYQDLFEKTAKLTDAQKDLSGALSKASNDTYSIDIGLEGIQLGIGAYQTYIGLLGLVGEENKDLQKTIERLLAVQQVAQGVQQIATFLTNEEGLALELKTLWTNLSTTATEGATIAQSNFNKVLLASGIGAVVIALGYLVANWDDVSRAISGTTKEQELLNSVNKKSQENAVTDIARLKILTTTAQNHALSQKKRNEAVKELQEQYPSYFGNLSKEKILNGNITKEIKSLTNALIAKAKVQAFEEKLVELYKQRFELMNKERELNDDITKSSGIYGIQALNIQRKIALLRKKGLREDAEDLGNQIGFTMKKMQEAINDTGGLNIFGSDDKPKDTAAEKAKRYFIEVNQVQSEEYKKAIEAAKKYYEDLQNTTENAQKQLSEAKINNISDSIQKELAQLDLSFELQGKALEKAIAENKQRLLDFATINPDKYDEVLVQIAEFEERANKIKIEYEYKYQNDKLEINKKYLELQLSQLKSNVELISSEQEKDAANEILAEGEKYAKKQITLEEYQTSIAKIEKKYREQRLQDSIVEYEAEINLLKDKLATANGIEATDIQTKINKLETAKANAENDLIDKSKVNFKDSLIYKIFGIDPDDPNAQAKSQQIQAAFASMVQSTISILKEQSKAEIEAFDQAITLQKERVTQAQKIAEGGNAEYLQMEEERLKELEAKREEAARKQLEIDAVIQGSQILVGIAGAVGQIATGGVAGVVAGIAAIGAAVATGYALMNSLNSSRPKFFDGTEGTVAESLGQPRRSGRDGYDISVDGSEMILNGKITKEITKHGLRASDLPDIVQNGLAFEAMKLRSDLAIGGNNTALEDRLSKIEKINMKQLKAFENIGISFNVDEDGVSAMIKSSSERKLKSQRA